MFGKTILICLIILTFQVFCMPIVRRGPDLLTSISGLKKDQRSEKNYPMMDILIEDDDSSRQAGGIQVNDDNDDIPNQPMRDDPLNGPPLMTTPNGFAIPKSQDISTLSNPTMVSFSNPELNETEEDYDNDDNDNDKKIREIFTIALFIITGVGLAALIAFKIGIDKYINPILYKKLSGSMRETILAISVISLVLWIDWAINLGDQLDIKIDAICTSLIMFCLAWFLISCIMIFIAHTYRNTWVKFENKIKKKDEVLAKFKELMIKSQNMKLTKEEKQVLMKAQHELEYFMMRQYFIAPTYHPTVSESFLRDDFDYSKYLTICFEKSLTSILGINSWAIMWFSICFIIWFSMQIIQQIYIQYIVFLGISIGSFFYLIICKYKLKSIKNQLVPETDKYIGFVFPKTSQITRDPYLNIELPIPDYLQKKVESSIFGLANQHEQLFWFNSPKSCSILLQLLLIMNIFFNELYIAQYLDQADINSIVICCVNIFIGLINIIFTLYLIKVYMIVTSIEMMKDYDIIEEVILTQKLETQEIFAKLYRFLKSTLREVSPDSITPVKINENIIKLIKESFIVVGEVEDAKINIRKLKILTSLLGNKLKDDELIYLARDSTTDMITISCNEFIGAVEQFSNDIKLEPYITSKDALFQFIEKKDMFISIKELKNILNSYEILDDVDIKNILHEVKYISWNENEIDIDHISAQIRNIIEGLPR